MSEEFNLDSFISDLGREEPMQIQELFGDFEIKPANHIAIYHSVINCQVEEFDTSSFSNDDKSVKVDHNSPSKSDPGQENYIQMQEPSTFLAQSSAERFSEKSESSNLNSVSESYKPKQDALQATKIT